ncbi:MAG: Lrp/AsnC family transcriptional regulator [Roseovarius sp.]|uniref:Lrp/AsnC family transcriptional regulator n=1 Tax=Roseovarius sp. TaxID=1486281 RepID=UPI0032EFE0C8
MKFSDQETALLREIQQDSAASLATLADRVGMAQSTLWRKLQEFDAAGIVTARVAILDPAKVGAKLCVFATVSLQDHSEASLAAFSRLIDRHLEILECHAITGSADYMLKIHTADVESYEHFMTNALLRSDVVRAVHSSFSLKALKRTTSLPV